MGVASVIVSYYIVISLQRAMTDTCIHTKKRQEKQVCCIITRKYKVKLV